MLNNLFSKKDLKIADTTDSSSIGDWLEDLEERGESGQLLIDVYQTEKKIIIRSAISGVKPENLKISLHNDLLSINGFRQKEQEVSEREYLYQECYWGSFSRSLILPHEVDSKKIEALLEDGILTITLYKSNAQDFQITVKN